MVGIGGFAGSALRYAISRAMLPLAAMSHFPWHSLLVNVVGSLLIGALVACRLTGHWYYLAVIGFCGGFATFSMFSLGRPADRDRPRTLPCTQGGQGDRTSAQGVRIARVALLQTPEGLFTRRDILECLGQRCNRRRQDDRRTRPQAAGEARRPSYRHDQRGRL